MSVSISGQGQDSQLSFIHQQDPLNPEYLTGELLIKFHLDSEIKVMKSGSITHCGIESIDKWFDFYQVIEIADIYPTSTHPNKINQSTRSSRIFHLRYQVTIDPKDFCNILEKDSNIVYAEPVFKVYSLATYPNDALYQSGEQWYINEINAPIAWDSTTCDTSQVIGIIDTGVDWDHPDLDGNIWRNWGELADNGLDDDGNGFIDDVRGWDFTTNTNDIDDDNGHGTHVAGVVAAETNNFLGIAGIAWNARIMPLKVLTGSGQGTTAWLTSAIYYAADNGATVINMSLGTYGESQAVKDALLYAYDTLTIVGAAGNDNLKVDTIAPPNQAYGPMFPGCYPFVIGVEAATQAGTVAGFSNFDPSGFSETANPDGFNYEIIAPGVNIFSTFPGGGYRYLTGTSMASPIVAGAVALIKDFNPGISNEEIFARLIQFAQAGHLKIPNMIHGRLEPDLFYVEHALIDTVGDADNDGHADNNETFDLWFTIKNAGGAADSSWAKLRLDYLGDTTLVNIIDSTSYIGDLDTAGYQNEIPAYTTMTGEADPFRVYIKPGVLNERDIGFEYEIGAKNGSPVTGIFYLTIQNGEELKGMLDTTFTLTADKFWLVNQSFKVTDSGKLIIEAGTHLKIDKGFVVDGIIEANGTKDSLIHIQGPRTFSTSSALNASLKYTKLFDFDNSFNGTLYCDHCIFEEFRVNFMFYTSGGTFIDCQFREVNGIFYWGGRTIIRCNFDNIDESLIHSGPTTAKFNNFNTRYGTVSYGAAMDFYMNNFATSDYHEYIYAYRFAPFVDSTSVRRQYWGTTNADRIDQMIWDFYEDPTYPILLYNPILTVPSDSAHGMVWKVLLDGIDPNEEYIDPIGIGNVQFDVYFNKPMDTLYPPLLTFGVRDPLTQHVVEDNAFWSTDSTVWTAYFDFEPETGDGMNFIRVANAVDTSGFRIPQENSMRFRFNVQAASSTSLQFIATPGIGKVFLEWPYDYIEDFLGYNMYRFERIDENTTTDTILLNESLIHDSTLTDFNAIPDSLYYYCYKIVGTDLKESDFSKIIAARPLSTANGDANGDEELNVLDITAIIAYIMEQEPQPFLFEAADVNYDSQVNVLDIVLIIQMISGKKNSPEAYHLNKAEYVFLSDSQITLESKNQISALQFELSGDNLETIRLLARLEGFEFNYTVKKDKIVGILFSYQNNVIPEGWVNLIEFLPNTNGLSWNKIIASDMNGNWVPIETSKQLALSITGAALTCNPNPFTGNTQFTFHLTGHGSYSLEVYTMDGKKVFERSGSALPEGKVQVNWNGNKTNGHELPAGIYLCNLVIEPLSTDQPRIEESIKIIKYK